MLVHSFFQRVGIYDTATHSLGFSRYPAVRSMFLVFFQYEFPFFTLIEMSKLGEAALHLFKKMENGFALAGQVHLRVQMHVDIEIVAQGTVWVHRAVFPRNLLM